MKNWTPDASKHFETWLGMVRRSIAGDRSVDANDVTEDLRAHVHAELESIPEPVTMGALAQVLDGLGTPAQWTDAARPIRDKPTVRARARRLIRAVDATITAWQQDLAGEWGLPVLLGVLTLSAIVTFDDGGFLLMVLAFFVARSQVKYARHALTGRRRWLVYLPLAIGSGVLAGIVLSFPLLIWGDIEYRDRFFVLWWMGAWWTFVGILTSREPKRVQGALQPFADSFEASHGRLLALIGAAFLIAASVILVSR